MKREEYLQRPLTEDVVFEINEDRVKISCPHTIFIDISKGKKVTLPEVERAFNQLKKAVTESGKVKLKGVSKFLPAVRALYPSYCVAIKKMESNFLEITELAKQIQTDGIHMGCRDDEYLEIITDKQSEVNKLFYRNSDYSRFMDYYNRVREVLQERHWEREGVIDCTITVA